MTWSTGEIGALALRAARGAGQPWGVAEEAAWAVRWLVRAGQPGAEALADDLAGALTEAGAEARQEPPAGGHGGGQGGGVAAGLMDGVALADGGVVPERLDPGASLLGLAFLARLAPPGRALVYSGGGTTFRIWAGGCDLLPGGRTLALAGMSACPDTPPVERAGISVRAHRVLGALARRTYAPASEASRLLGAGAGLNDND